MSTEALKYVHFSTATDTLLCRSWPSLALLSPRYATALFAFVSATADDDDLTEHTQKRGLWFLIHSVAYLYCRGRVSPGLQ